MRVLTCVEVDQVTGIGPDNRAVAVDSLYTGRRSIVRDYQFPAHRVIGAEEQAGQRVGVDVTLEPHGRAVLYVEYDPIAVVASRHHALRASLAGQFKKRAVVELIQPGEASAHLIGVDATAMDVPDGRSLSRKGRRGRELAEISIGGDRADFLLPA